MNLDEQTNIEITQHNISSYKPKGWCGSKTNYLTTLKFNVPGNYKIRIKEYKHNEESIDYDIFVDCVNN